MGARQFLLFSAITGLVSVGCAGAPVPGTSASGSSTGGDASTGGTEPTTGEAGSTGSTGDTGEASELPRGPLKAGTAAGYLTGPVGASMAGYGGRTVTNETAWNVFLNGAAGFYGYGSVKAIAVEVEGERLVLLKMPTMSGEHSLTEGTIAKLKDKHGIDLTGRLIASSTHSHHNLARYWRLPDQLGFIGADAPDEEIIDRMTTALAEVVARAIDDLAPAQWGVAQDEDWDPDDRVHRDRRGENNPTYGKDRRLTMLAVRRPDGTPMAAILNFGMHGTVFDSDNELFTEDAPGGLEMKFEESFFAKNGQPIFGMFVQSGGGDASPAGDALGHPGPARIEMIGETAAPKLLAIYDQVDWRDEAALGVRSRRIDLTYSGIGYDDYPEFKNAGGKPYLWGGWSCKGPEGTVDDGNPATSLEGMPKNCMALDTLITSFGGTIPNGEVHQTYLTVAALDDFYLVSLPGEPAASTIQYLRGQLKDRAVDGMAFGYSQDHLLYLTHPDDWLQGGYESEMSLWGPLLAKYLVDRQMEMVDALDAGEGQPVWSEESPALSVGKPFEPRAVEAGTEPPGVTLDVAAEAGRGETVRFGWTGGDPGLGEPLVTVQVDRGRGFVDVPAPSGWPGKALDNSRYHMLTHYAPSPEPNGDILPARSHRWYVDWQVPADMPAGTYRLRALGRAHDGQIASEYALESKPFAVTAGKTEAKALLAGGTLTLALTLGPPPYMTEGTWPIAGFRLLDGSVGPDQPATIRAPLTLVFVKDGQQVGDAHEVAWTPGQGHVFDFAATGLAADGLSVRINLRDDVAPSPIEAPVEVP